MPENDTPVSKSQAVRDFSSEPPDASSTGAVDALAAHGLQVSPALVSTVRATQAPVPVPEPEASQRPKRRRLTRSAGISHSSRATENWTRWWAVRMRSSA